MATKTIAERLERAQKRLHKHERVIAQLETRPDLDNVGAAMLVIAKSKAVAAHETIAKLQAPPPPKREAKVARDLATLRRGVRVLVNYGAPSAVIDLVNSAIAAIENVGSE